MSLSIGPGINIVGSVIITPAIGTTIPDNPIIGIAFSNVQTSANVSYTAPSDNGGSTILKYIATSTPSGLTGTLNQAGSGTITADGKVGAIGGISEKIIAAKKAGATVLFASRENCGEIPENVGGISVVAISTLEEAMTYLRKPPHANFRGVTGCTNLGA